MQHTEWDRLTNKVRPDSIASYPSLSTSVGEVLDAATGSDQWLWASWLLKWASCMELPDCQLVGSVGNLENYRLCIMSKICTRYGGTVVLPWSMLIFWVFLYFCFIVFFPLSFISFITCSTSTHPSPLWDHPLSVSMRPFSFLLNPSKSPRLNPAELSVCFLSMNLSLFAC